MLVRLHGGLGAAWGLALGAALLGCSGRTGLRMVDDDATEEDAGPPPDAGPPLIEQSDKLDVLLVVDNSKNTSAAQDLLARTLPYLLERLIRPACVNGLGNVVAETDSSEEPCPVGERDFPPMRDMHVGVISTSIGGHGADTCGPTSTTFNPLQNDAAHLLSRTATGGVVPTYEHGGFLAWDPGQDKVPPGELDLPTVTQKLDQIVRGAGNVGCGFESQLESIYRFVVDPDPYLEISVVGGGAQPTGTDQLLLEQRADFLRPDSALLILLLTDENDCSTREEGQYYLSNQALSGGMHYHLPRARAVCERDPDDPCCASCAQPTPDGCAPSTSDPGCQAAPFTDVEDPVNLRCWDQKRRFGVDFLYPTDRYVRALSQPTVEARGGAEVESPLFAGGRSPKLVFLAGIVGVPWQDIAHDPSALATGFLPGTQVDWELLLGDGEGADPLMRESIVPRTGANPRTGDELAPPSATTALANPINGHERAIAAADDLQYACIYPLRTPRECSSDVECECFGDGVAENPICQQQDGSYAQVQRFARALPSIRPLRVIQGLGTQGVVGSICAQNVDDEASATFAYKPAIDAALRSLRTSIAR
jgi:hypothetical protein